MNAPPGLSVRALELALAQVEAEGPVAVDDVVAGVAAADELVDRDDLIDALVDQGGIWWIGDHLLGAEHVLPGRRFSHRLSAEEIARGNVVVDLDLHLLTLDESASFETPLGPFVEEHRPRVTMLVGPVGCFASLTAGDVIAVQWVARGALDIARIDQPGDGDLEVRMLRTAFEQERGRHGVTTLLDILVAACRSDHAAFEAAPPLTELLARADLSVSGSEVADASFDWAACRAERRQDYVRSLAEQYDLDLAEAGHLATLALGAVWDDPADGDVDVHACAVALRDPGAVAAFLERKTSRRPSEVQGLRALATATLDATEPEPPAGAHLVLARAAELGGDALGHAREVDTALRLDPAFWPAFEDVAWVRTDRGDLRGAAAALEQVVEDDHPRLLVLDRYSAPGPMTAGRNERCPCGSGRKHKVCCGQTNGYRLVDRAPLLFEKAMWFASRPAQADDVRAMIEDVVEDADVSHGEIPWELFGADPILMDIALFTAGLMVRFRNERGVMLPADERTLLDQWCDAQMRILRIERWGDNADLVVADLVEGDELVVWHHGVDDSLAPGNVIAAAVLFDGERHSILGWVQVADSIVGGLASDGLPSLVRFVVEERLEQVADTLAQLEATRAGRLAWLFPDADPDDRRDLSLAELIELEHPELVAAIAAGRDEVRIEGGHEINPRLHLAVHEIVAEQILADDPREMWVTAVRLGNRGYDQHEILHMLASTVSHQVFGMLGESRHYDRAEHLEELAALPETWEAARDVHRPTPPRGGRHGGRHRRH